jgi:hypothetical protein
MVGLNSKIPPMLAMQFPDIGLNQYPCSDLLSLLLILICYVSQQHCRQPPQLACVHGNRDSANMKVPEVHTSKHVIEPA